MTVKMPDGKALTKEITNSLPLYCYIDISAKQLLAKQGIPINEKMRLKIVGIDYMGEAGGITCVIERPDDEGIFAISATQVCFSDEGEVYDRLNEYREARLQWLRQEEMIDKKLGRGGRINVVEKNSDGSMRLSGDDSTEIITFPNRADATRKISRNAPCPCGSGKKYKKCCGLR